MYREKELSKENKKLLEEFEKEWYPASDTPRIADFLIWIQGNSYAIVKVLDCTEIK